MAHEPDFQAEFNRIAEINNPPLVAHELHLKSYEFRDAYRALRRKMRNDKYRITAKDKINESRREKYKLQKELNPRPIVAKIPKVDIEAVNTEIKREDPAPKRDIEDLSDNTVVSYINIIKKIYKHYNGKECEDTDHLIRYLNADPKYNTQQIYKYHSYIIDKAEDIFNTFQKDIPQLYSVFSKFKGKKLPTIAEKLYPFMKAVNKNYVDNRGKDVYVNESACKNVSFDRDDVIKNMDKLEDDEKLLYALTFLQPIRRLHDFRFMRHATHTPDKPTDDINYNWVINGELIVINNTKNKDKMGIPITDEYLKKIIMLHAHKSNTDFVLGKYYEPHALTRMFSKIMSKVYDYNFNFMDIRHLYCTHMVKNMNNLTSLKENARAVGHNLTEHLAYVIPTGNPTEN